MQRFIYIICLLLGIARAEFIGELAYGYNFYQYKEPHLMKIQGTLHEISGKLGVMWLDTIGAEILASSTIANDTTYKGQTAGGTPLTLNSEDRIWNAGFRVGYPFESLNENLLHRGFFYTGFMYRYLYNDTDYAYSYRRKQEYFTIPLGYHGLLGDGVLSMRYGAEFQFIVLGVNRTYLGDYVEKWGIPCSIFRVCEPLKFKQRNSFRIKAHVGFEHRIHDMFKYFVQLHANYIRIKDSNKQYATLPIRECINGCYFYEPRNNTIQIGVEFGIGF